jgi:hypothetical protein
MISSPLLFLNKEMPTEPTNLPEVLARNYSDNPNRAIDPKFRRDEVEKTSLIR